MGLIEIASNNAVWRRMDYYNNKKSFHGKLSKMVFMREWFLVVKVICIQYI